MADDGRPRWPRVPPPPEVLAEVTDEQGAQIPDWAKERALVEVNYAYESIAGMASLPLDVLNRVRPEDMKYRTPAQLIQEYTARASAVADFAVTLKLITPEQALQAILQFQERHPEIWGELDPEPPPDPA